MVSVTLLDLQTRTLERLDEDTSGGGYFSASEVAGALNEGQRMFVLLTLCLESNGTQALDAGVSFYRMLNVFADWLLPLRVRVHGTGGQKLDPSRLQDLTALNPAWENEAGTPARYSHLGLDLVAIHKRPSASGTSLDWTYARMPAKLRAESDTPEIPEENHLDLIDYAIPLLRAKEGGAAFLGSLAYFDRFLESAMKKAEYVRARNKAQLYDRGPFEMKDFDRSRLVETLRKSQGKP